MRVSRVRTYPAGYEKTPKVIMTKKGRIANVNDLIAIRKQAILTANMLKLEKETEQAYTDLMKDISSYNSYRSHGHGWYLTVGNFTKLAPVFKAAFQGVTRDSMKLLLTSIRNHLIKRREPDHPQYRKHLRYTYGGRNRQNYNKYLSTSTKIPCMAALRLFPLHSQGYESFFYNLLMHRFGIKFCVDNYFRLSKGGGCVAPLIEPDRISFICGDQTITKEGVLNGDFA